VHTVSSEEFVTQIEQSTESPMQRLDEAIALGEALAVAIRTRTSPSAGSRTSRSVSAGTASKSVIAKSTHQTLLVAVVVNSSCVCGYGVQNEYGPNRPHHERGGQHQHGGETR
jgi:hypothetical protein